MKFSILFPGLRHWVLHLDKIWPAYIVKPNFAYWEVLHILAIVILGGCSILLGLRLLGFGLTEEKPSELYKNLKLWLHTGVIGVIVTGVLIGMANAEKLYDSPAFFVKIVSLLAGVIITYFGMRPIALANGEVTGRSAIGGAVGLAVWAFGLAVFLNGGLMTPGFIHVMTAGALILLFITRGALRWIYTAGVVVALVAYYLATHVFIPWGDLKHADPANVIISILLGLWMVGVAIAQAIMNRRNPESESNDRGALFAKVMGYAVILVWVSAAAAGRWIAYG
jgi:hypothetical protein